MRRALFVALVACADTLPPYGEALVVVDTDLPPAIAGRLRVDLYAEDGTWLESRDLARPDARDWPSSFGVYTKAGDRAVLVRLRAYPEGAVRDYRGERFADLPDLIKGSTPSGDGTPRLFVEGRDATPPTEPDPALAIDRMLRVRVRYGARGRTIVTLRGECAGVMSSRALGTCVESRGRAPIPDATLDPSLETPPRAPRQPECAARASADRVCVPSGAMVLGDARRRAYPGNLAPFPVRVVVLSDFVMDRREVTVARFRAAMASGFQPSVAPVANEADLGTLPDARSCTFSAAPRGREDYALTCVDWSVARDFCRFQGGDLPTEAQWEYAATSADRALRVDYPWGDEVPECGRAVYGRTPLAGAPGVCEALGIGPRPAIESASDQTTLGIEALGGGVAELVRDGYVGYADACWIDASPRDPVCEDASRGHVARGGSWAAPPTAVLPAYRLGPGVERLSFIGFRCVYPPR